MIWWQTHQNISSYVRTFNIKHITFHFAFLQKQKIEFIHDIKKTIFWLITYHSKTQLKEKRFIFLTKLNLYNNLQNNLRSLMGTKMYWNSFCVSSVICIELPFILKGSTKNTHQICKIILNWIELLIHEKICNIA